MKQEDIKKSMYVFNFKAITLSIGMKNQKIILMYGERKETW